MQTRRQFVVRAGTAAATAILSPSAMAAGLDSARKVKLAHGGRFSEGVMSGEPTPSAITLWTRLADIDGAVGVDLEVATDKSFRHVVAHKRLTTSAAVNHNVKSRITGLKAHEQYYYRFATATKDGPVGRFRTALPADSQQPVRFAFWSCQDYTHGYYNAHERMAQRGPRLRRLPRRLHLRRDLPHGQGRHRRCATTRSAAPSRSPARPASTTRARPRRSTRLPRQVRAVPLGRVAAQDAVAVPDRDALGRPRGAGQLRRRRARTAGCPPAITTPASARRPPTGRSSSRCPTPRRPDSRRASTARLQFGRTVDLLVMDQRQYRANQPCDDATGVPACADYNQPRRFLGTRQMNWLKSQLKSSKAAWKVMANEVMIMPTRVLGGAFFGFDSWQGYPQEREELLTHIRDRQIKDVVFVTGDIHTFIAGDVQDQRRRRRPGRDRVRRRLDHLAGPRRDRPAGRRRHGHQGQRQEPAHRPGDHRRAARASTRGSTAPTSTTTATARSSPPGRLRLRDGAHEDDQEEVDGQAPRDRHALPRRTRAAVDQGHVAVARLMTRPGGVR